MEVVVEVPVVLVYQVLVQHRLEEEVELHLM
jgi:hypothetical protein